MRAELDGPASGVVSGALRGQQGGLEGLDDGDDRGGLGLVALPAPDLEGETMTVD